VETLRALDGRTQMLEHAAKPSRHVQKIIEQGPRHVVNFQTAETDRTTVEAKEPTIH
jgi:hypothetical protein